MVTREELRRRLARTPRDRKRGPGRDEGWLHGDDPARDALTAAVTRRTPAAVLIGVVERPGGLAVLLTQRTEHLRDHAGQISFPGGRIERRRRLARGGGAARGRGGDRPRRRPRSSSWASSLPTTP